MIICYDSSLSDSLSALYILADTHGLLIIRFKELKVLIGLHCLPAVLAQVKHWQNWKTNGKNRLFFSKGKPLIECTNN